MASNIPLTTHRDGAIEALYRFVLALDDYDEQMLATAITEDMRMDLSDFQKVGLKFEAFEGRANVVSHLSKYVLKSLDSMHHLSNFIVDFSSDQEARISCYAWAQHFRLEEGPKHDCNDHFSAGNRYKATVVRPTGGAKWLVKELRVSPGWVEGQREVIASA